MNNSPKLDRRRFLLSGAATSLAVAACRDRGPTSTERAGSASTPTSSGLGAGRRPYGERSPFEKAGRIFKADSPTPGTGSSRTPLQDSLGIITPSALHFERHHSGVPTIDPNKHELVIHGLVERPLAFTMADLRRFPSVSRIHFCPTPGVLTPDQVYALTAFVLQMNGVITADTALTQATLPRVQMPNRDGFVSDPRPDVH